MRLFFYFKKYWKLYLAIFVLVVAIIVAIILSNYKFLPEGSVRKINRDYEYQEGPVKIGNSIPIGPGGSTFSPILEIPSDRKFYVGVVQQDIWCSNESCGIDGSIVQTMGGWIEVEKNYQPETRAMFGLDLPENKNIKSVVVVGDKNGKIVGIYLNKDYKDTLSILKQNHSDLADFNKLSGVKEFSKLRIGDKSPLLPGDNISNLFSKNAKNPITEVPKDKKFYLFSLEKKSDYTPGIYNQKEFKMGEFKREYNCFLGSCRYSYPDNPHDFLFSEIDELGGWFLANDNDNSKMAELFGLKQEDILSGKSSLVVLTDLEGKIVALHPNKTLSDAITILSQHPELVSLESI